MLQWGLMIKHSLRRVFAYVDLPLLFLLLTLAGIGQLTVMSATGGGRVESNLINLCVALIAMLVMTHIPPQRLIQFSVPVYVLGLLLLVGVALAGDVVNGSRRWLNLGVARIQPSELMRLGVPLMLAAYLHYRQEALDGRVFFVAALLLLLPVGLVLRQPDLGTALLIASAGFFVLFLGGLSWRLIGGMGVALAAALPLIWHFGLHDYQRRRVLTLIDPGSEPLGAGYHIIQSTIAIGSGGFFGKGWMHGSQARLDFLPEGHTDFIFAVWSEEFGMLGNLLLMTLYAAIVVRGLQLANQAPSLFGRLMCGAITLTFLVYAFVNMGMVSGILPVVGVPLPLVSYGGTSMMTVLLGFGIVMAISSRKTLVKS
jgi:rod shape determining protein RodA